MDAKLPGDKVSKCLPLLKKIFGKKSCRLRELQQLLGFLNFCCQVKVGDRALKHFHA